MLYNPEQKKPTPVGQPIRPPSPGAPGASIPQSPVSPVRPPAPPQTGQQPFTGAPMNAMQPPPVQSIPGQVSPGYQRALDQAAAEGQRWDAYQKMQNSGQVAHTQPYTPGSSPGLTPVTPGQGRVPPQWVDPNAAAADPAGFQNWFQQYMANSARSTNAPTGGEGGIPSVDTNTQQPTALPGVVEAAGPGVDQYGLPTAGQAGGVNQQVMDLFNQLQQQANSPAFNQAQDYLNQASEFAQMDPAIERSLRSAIQRSAGGAGAAAPNVDRVALAERALRRFDESGAPEFDRQIRGVGQAAAAFGRTGSGMTTNDLTNVLDQQRSARRRFGESTIDTALGNSVQDAIQAYNAQTGRIGTNNQGLSALSSLYMGGRQNAFGNTMGLAEGTLGIDAARRGATAGAIGAGQGISDQLFGQDQSIRGERRQLDRDAQGDRINEILLENELSGTAFQQAMQKIQTMANLGLLDQGAAGDVNSALLY